MRLFYKKIKDFYFFDYFKKEDLCTEEELKNSIWVNPSVVTTINNLLPKSESIKISVEAINIQSIAEKDIVAIPISDKGTLGKDEKILFSEKDEMYKDLEKIVKGLTDSSDQLIMMKYMVLFNKFASKGIFITPENKEDKYIEIIEQDDEQLLTDLEEYLNIQKLQEKKLNKLSKIIQLKEEIDFAYDLDEIKEIKEKILQNKYNISQRFLEADDDDEEE